MYLHNELNLVIINTYPCAPVGGGEARHLPPPHGFLENKTERKKEIYQILTQEIQVVKKNSIANTLDV
jgi:hypothetical protein